MDKIGLTEIVATKSRVPLGEVAWVVLHVGEDERCLLVQYYWGGRYLNEPRVRLEEGAGSIEIAVCLPDLHQDPNVRLIREFAAAGQLEVGLGSPVSGRNIIGPGRAFLNPGGQAFYRRHSSDANVYVAPRVVGLTPEDARWVLRAQGFELEIEGDGGEIVSQDPGPSEIPSGQGDEYHGTIHLIAGDGETNSESRDSVTL